MAENDLDAAMIDRALMTTRGVRRRLDLEREVDDQVLLDCIDVAEQAPTGGNNGSRRWIIIRDQATKDRFQELYLEAGASWVIEAADRIEGTDHPNASMMQGAKRLAENIDQVPAIVILTVIGEHDGSGRPGLFDSVIQAGWSFQVALRARGLGTVWTSMYLNKAAEVAELLDIPDGLTQVCMFPVAYTIGTDFSPTKRRLAAREITYFDRFGRTIGGRRTQPASMANMHGVAVEVDIKAHPSKVWKYVSDINLPARFSGEFVGADWDDPGADVGVGSTFIGHNDHSAIGQWDVDVTVTHYEEEQRFGWRTGGDENPGALWLFELEYIPGGTRLRYLLQIGPGRSGLNQAIDAMPDKEPRIIARRQSEHMANMRAVIAGIKDLAEAGGS